MPVVVRGSKLVLLILGVGFLISLIILPNIFSLIIFSIVLVYFSWWWYKHKYRTLDFRRIGKPLLREKLSFNSDIAENQSNYSNKNMGTGYSSNNNGDKSKKSDSRSLNSNRLNSSRSLQGSMSQELRDSQIKYKSVQTAAGPLLSHSNVNDSYLDQNTSLLRDGFYRGKYFDNRRNFSSGSGYLMDTNRSIVAPRRRYPTHQPKYVFLGHFPSVSLVQPTTPIINLNNSLNQNRVTVKLAPPQVLTPSQRISFSTSLSPSKISPKNRSLISEPNPCDTQTVLAALKDNRKRARKEKDNAIENEAKRRRQQETDSESSDSSIVITTSQNMDTNGDILMKTLQGKRPATPLVCYESPSVQGSSKRYKNDILTVSYSSSKKFFKEDALLILPNKKRQASNSSPPSNKVSKTKESDLSEDDIIEVDLTQNDAREKEVDLNNRSNEMGEEKNSSEESLVTSPPRIEGQSHKRSLDCYAKLGKSSTNVYNVPQYLPTLSDCEEHKKIEEDRVRRLLGTPLKKIPSVSLTTTPSFQPLTSFSSPISSAFDSAIPSSISLPELTIPSLNPASFTSASNGFGKPVMSTLETSSASLTTTSITPSSGSFLSTGLNTKTSEPISIVNDNQKSESLSKTIDTSPNESISSPSEKGNAFLNCFLANVGKEPNPSSTVSLISSSSTASFTEAFKFSSNPSSMTNTISKAATSPTTSNSSVKSYPFAIHSKLNEGSESQLNKDLGTFVPNSSISSGTVSSSTLGFGSTNPVLSFSSPNNIQNANSAQSITVPDNENKVKSSEVNTTSSGLFSFSSSISTASNQPKVIQFADTTQSQVAPTTNLVSSAVSTPQFSIITSTPYQLPSNASTQPVTASVTAPMFQFSNSPTAQPAATPSSATSLQFSGQISQAPTVTTTGTSIFSFGAKTNETPNSSVVNPNLSQPSNFFGAQENKTVKNLAFGSGGPLPSYSEATSTTSLPTSTQVTTSTVAFGSVPTLSTQSFSFGTQQASTVSGPFANPPPAYPSGFGSSQTSAFGSTPSSSAQVSFGATATNTTPSVFGLNDQTKNSTNSFSFGSANQPNTFGSTPSLPNAFGTTQPSTNAFRSAQTSSNAFGSSQSSTNTFGSVQPSTNAFGSAQPSSNAFGSAQPLANAFGTTQTSSNAFGTSQPSTNTFGSTQPSTNTFGNAQPSTNAFGGAQSSNAFGNPQTSTSAFGSIQPSANTFGSSQPTTNAFGNPQTSTSAFGSIQPLTNTFGSSQPTTNAFGNTQPTSNPFGSTQTSVNSFGNNQPSVNSFGSTQPPVNSFGSTQPPVNSFGSTQPSVNSFGSTQPSVNSFGSSLLPTATAFGSTQPSSTAFGSTQPSSTAFGSAQPSVNAFQFNVASKNFNFGSTPTPEQPAFGTSQQLPQPYIFGGGQPTVPTVDPNTGSQLFSIGSGVRDKRVVAPRRRARK